MPDFNFEDLLNKFRNEQETSPLLRLANDWLEIADNAAGLALRYGKLIGDKNA